MRHVNPPFISNHQGTWYTKIHPWDHPYTLPHQKKWLLLQSSITNTHTKSQYNKINRTYNIPSSQSSQYHQQEQSYLLPRPGSMVPKNLLQPQQLNAANIKHQGTPVYLSTSVTTYTVSASTSIGLCGFSINVIIHLYANLCSINNHFTYD